MTPRSDHQRNHFSLTRDLFGRRRSLDSIPRATPSTGRSVRNLLNLDLCRGGKRPHQSRKDTGPDSTQPNSHTQNLQYIKRFPPEIKRVDNYKHVSVYPYGADRQRLTRERIAMVTESLPDRA